jgi:hypothetical protein
MQDRLANLAAEIEAAFPEAKAELESFPSGAAMLDVRRGGRLFVLAYTPRGGFGVDEVGEEEGFDTGYKFVSEGFDEAAEELRRLLRSAA